MANERTERAIDIIVDGFIDNPVLGWVFEDEATRADGIRGYVEVFLTAYGERGVLDIDEGGDGAALWAEPGTPQLEGEHAVALVELLREFNGERTNLVLSTLGRVKPPNARRVRFWVDVPDAALGEAALEDAKVISDGSSEETKDKAQTP